MTRKAILFSMISVLLATFFMLLFWSANAPRLERTTSAIETRVGVMDRYVASWDGYAEDALRLSTRGALIEMTGIYTDNRTPVDVSDIIGNLSECLSSGVFNPTRSTVGCMPGGVADTYAARLNNFSSVAQNELDITTTINTVTAYQIQDWSPFELLIVFTMNYTIGDPFASWNRSKHHDVVVSVIGLPDPLFSRYRALYTGLPGRNITKYPVPREVLSIQNLSDMIATEAFVENRGVGPTYLERMAGIITGDLDEFNSSGIETIIEPDLVAPFLIDPLNYSYVAHQLFAQEIFICGDQTLGINSSMGFAYPTLRLDVPHIAWYNMNNITFWNHTCS